MEPKNVRRKIPWTAIILTAVVSVALTWAGLRLFGYHSPHLVAVNADTPSGGAGQTQLWTCGMHPWIITQEPGLCPICGMELVPKRNEAAPRAAGSGERTVAYWRAPMNPMEIYDAPGKSKMGMDLVPVYEDELVGGVDIKIDPVFQQDMGVRMAPVEKGPLNHTIRTYGHITYDETRTALISPKVDGWIEHLFVNFTGEIVKKGQPLFDIYSPQLLAAQEEYLSAFRNFKRMGGINRELLDSARMRLSYFDVADDEIQAIEASDAVKKTLMIRSPADGVVVHRNAVEGGFIKAGTTIYTVSDLSRVWVEAHIYEYELDQVAKGQDAVVTLPYHPGGVYRGKVAYVYPYLQQKTRDVVVRVELMNPDMALKPEMYVTVNIRTTGEGDGLMIPSEAVIRTGERDLVFVARGDGRFSPRKTTLGLALDDGKVQVLSGLGPGDIVVTSGQFLLDSESQLREAVQNMMPLKTGKDQAKPTPKSEEGTAGKKDFFEDMGPSSDSGDAFFNDMK